MRDLLFLFLNRNYIAGWILSMFVGYGIRNSEVEEYGARYDFAADGARY